MRAFAFGLVALGLAAGCGDDDDEGVCTVMACGTDIAISGPIAGSPAAISVELCLNARCAGSASIADSENTTVDAALTFSASRYPAGKLFVELDLEANGVVAHDGDVVELKVRDLATDALIIDRSWTLTYMTYYPNGPDCGPTCVHAPLEL